jgi:hypothetical protein
LAIVKLPKHLFSHVIAENGRFIFSRESKNEWMRPLPGRFLRHQSVWHTEPLTPGVTIISLDHGKLLNRHCGLALRASSFLLAARWQLVAALLS